MKIKEVVRTYKKTTGGWLDKRFGDHWAQISTINTLKVKSAILDTARFTYGRVPAEIALLANRIETPPQGLSDAKFVFGYEDAGNWVEGSLYWDPALQEYVKRYPEQWVTVQKALGLVKSLGRHAGGVAIANEPIQNIIPTMDIKGHRCTAVPMGAVEYAGILKYDFLVVNALNDIQQSVKLVQDRSGREFPEFAVLETGKVPRCRLLPAENGFYDVWTTLPRDDQKVFEAISKGQTSTVFQFDTSSAKKWLTHFNYKTKSGRYLIDSIEKMALFTALDRPGPLDISLQHPENPGQTHNALIEYTRRARGLPGSKDILPVFEELFPETLGALIYQEQLTKAYQELTGCDGIEAQTFRIEVGKKAKEKILKRYKPFLERVSPKYGPEVAQKLWDDLGTWANYGFNFSHAKSYALTAYVCGYLKQYYPLEWWCAVLQNAAKNEISERFWPYCKNLVLLPDFSNPNEKWEIRGDKVAAPIGLLLGIGETAEQNLAKFGPYTDIRDFVQKMQAHRESTATFKTETKQLKKGPKVTVKKVLGRAPVNSGVVYTGVVGGTADSLFPTNTTLVEKLGMYELVRAEVMGGKVEPVKDKYLNLNIFQEHLLKKRILPMVPTNLAQMLFSVKSPMVTDTYGFPQFNMHGKWYRMMTVEEFQHYQTQNGGDRGFFMAIGGMVQSTRVWRYGEYKECEACELIFEVDGEFVKVVKWPDRKTKKLDPRFNASLEGSLAVVLLNKWSDRPFNVADIAIVQGAMSKAPERDKNE